MLYFCVLALAACGESVPAGVQDLDTEAVDSEGRYISWREHWIDDQASSGIELRGAVALAVADLNQDGRTDVASVFSEPGFVRVAYGRESPDDWLRLSLAEGAEARGAADLAVGDMNGDGRLDIVVAAAGLLYLENPEESAPGFRWARTPPAASTDGGPWRRVSLADLNGDGALDAAAANAEAVFLFTPGDDPSQPGSWESTEVGPFDQALTLKSVDLDRDGDMDVFVGGASELVWFSNAGDGAEPAFERRTIASVGGWADVADVNGDERLDVVVGRGSEIQWLEQPADAAAPWPEHAVGSIAPDQVAGLRLTDLDGDGKVDLLAGAASDGPADEDSEALGPESPLGRLCWFQNPGEAKEWARHDIVRRVRGGFRAFVAADMDQDDDVDFIGVRSSSGEYDGVFWMQQLHSDAALVRFQAGRDEDSQAMPLP